MVFWKYLRPTFINTGGIYNSFKLKLMFVFLAGLTSWHWSPSQGRRWQTRRQHTKYTSPSRSAGRPQHAFFSMLQSDQHWLRVFFISDWLGKVILVWEDVFGDILMAGNGTHWRLQSEWLNVFWGLILSVANENNKTLFFRLIAVFLLTHLDFVLLTENKYAKKIACFHGLVDLSRPRLLDSPRCLLLSLHRLS